MLPTSPSSHIMYMYNWKISSVNIQNYKYVVLENSCVCIPLCISYISVKIHVPCVCVSCVYCYICKTLWTKSKIHGVYVGAHTTVCVVTVKQNKKTLSKIKKNVSSRITGSKQKDLEELYQNFARTDINTQLSPPYFLLIV